MSVNSVTKRVVVLLVAAAAAIAAIAVLPAGAAQGHLVPCIGTADFCGATVHIGGGARNRVVTVGLTDTNLQLAGVWSRPGRERTGFILTRDAFLNGGSEFRFTLNALSSSPRNSVLVLMFVAGGAAGHSGLSSGKPIRGTWRPATAVFRVGTGMTVSIVGGGSGTSNCTRDETNTTFTTTGDGQSVGFGFDSKGSGSCFWEPSWSEFRVTVKNPSGSQIGSGVMSMQQNNAADRYYAACNARFATQDKAWRGLKCINSADWYDRRITIERSG